ncbi:hypothetical protein DSL64_23850 [Dyadobacter luteus]|uniref:Glycosyltransferase RgtA/B/C/D-like domain-containing protein n=1 Tax=Dyadobacter luteus TaxID=2259619 RepID=A0A3D8Y5N7_9BACT|nr:hypothetical protein [Dyadobacter luteus]REA57392.1 hypothetical protein DSL64_23850 [Dyadobacter luteus]
MLLPRWYYVESFAVALPFWDQWDAEGDWLLRPWLEGTFQLSDLWHPQNEHWLIPSHILILLCYELSGSWSNIIEARINIFLGVLAPLIMIWHLYNRNALIGWRLLLIPVLIAGVALPFAWENILFGFQSQFYFLCFFAVTALLLSSQYPYVPLAVMGVLVLSVLSIFTMASGLLTPIAVACVYLMHQWMLPVKRSQALLIISILLMMAFIAYKLMPYVAGHSGLHAQNVGQFLASFVRHIGWPLTARKLIICVIWIPAAIIITSCLVKRKLTKTDILMAGCFVWSTLQAAAMAYGRGGELGEVISRYTDLLTLGIAGNAWFVIRWKENFYTHRKFRYVPGFLLILFFAALFGSYRQRFRSGLNSMRKSHEDRMIQQQRVEAYLTSGDQRCLVQGQIPYPDPVRLSNLLDNAALRSTLPYLEAGRAGTKK